MQRPDTVAASPYGHPAVITLDTALATARRTLATVAERAEQHGYYAGAHTPIVNSQADLRPVHRLRPSPGAAPV